MAAQESLWEVITALSTERFHIWTPKDIYVDPLPPLQWAIHGLAPVGSLGMLSAFGNSGKSWLASDMLDAIAGSRKWLGRFNMNTHGPTMLIDYEAGDYEVRRRLRGIAAANETGEPPVHFVTMPDVYLSDSVLIARLERLAGVFKLIVVDTLGAGSPGLDQNDPRFADCLYKMRAIGNRTGCLFLVLHHNRKSGKDANDDLREAIRGTGAIFASLDWCLVMVAEGDDAKVLHVKARGGKKGAPFVVHVEDVAEGEFMVRSREVVKEADDSPADRMLAHIVRHPGQSRNEACSPAKSGGAGIRRQEAFAAVEQLENDEAISCRDGRLFANHSSHAHTNGAM
jgi:hypothetical protein